MCIEYCGRETNKKFLLSTEDSKRIENVISLLREARKSVAQHMFPESGGECYLCGTIESDLCRKSHDFELAEKIDIFLNTLPGNIHRP